MPTHGVPLFDAKRQVRDDVVEHVVRRDAAYVPLHSFQHQQLAALHAASRHTSYTEL